MEFINILGALWRNWRWIESRKNELTARRMGRMARRSATDRGPVVGLVTQMESGRSRGIQDNMLHSTARIILPQRIREWYWGWRKKRTLPDAARIEDVNDRRSSLPDPGIPEAVDVALRWLCRAQDSSTSADGGVARHFSMILGWGESYPETTGYIIPTMIKCGAEMQSDEFTERSRRMLDWCISIQLPDGSFQGGTISADSRVPTTFNTGQILLGLAVGAKIFGDTKYNQAMHRAASWLRDTQDTDGCWRRFPTPFARPGEKVYETHVSWGLFEAARVAPGSGYGEAGLKQVHWALTKQRENGWFADCCLNDPDRPLTHTIGYVLRGILEAYRFSNEEAFLDAARRTGRGTLASLQEDGRLPGRLKSDWRPAASWVCLTGQVQLAYCWLMLFELTGERSFLRGARKANAFVRKTVKTQGHPDIVGGVKGSFPIGGDYGSYEYLSWAAKFFIDSNRYEDQIMDKV